jgi:hypothetical protein
MAKYYRISARILGLVYGILIFVFALFSGAEAGGNSLEAVIKNSPNALPWLFYLLIVLFAWKRELIGGLLLVALGIFFLFFFGVFSHFMLSTFIIVSLVIINGLLFLGSWWKRK